MDVDQCSTCKQKYYQLLFSEMHLPNSAFNCSATELNLLCNFKYLPNLDLENAKMGIFGQALGTKGLKPPKEYEMQPGDRVEIYRPLISDPKEVRRRRAAEKAEKEASEKDKRQ